MYDGVTGRFENWSSVDLLAGEPGHRRDIVLLNAAYALVAAGKVPTPAEGILMAAEAIDSGRALQQLEKLAELTNKN